MISRNYTQDGFTRLSSWPPVLSPDALENWPATVTHGSLALIYIVFIAWLIAAQTQAPLHLRVTVITGSLGATLYHTLLGSACASRSISLALHDWDGTYSFTRVRSLPLFAHALVLATATSYCIIEASGKFRIALLAFANVPALTTAYLILHAFWRGWNEEMFLIDLRLIQISFMATMASSALTIFVSTGSRTMCNSGYLACAFGACGALLEKAYNVGPYLDHPHIFPHHWAAPVVLLLIDLSRVSVHVASGYTAISHSYLQQALMPIAACTARFKAKESPTLSPVWYVMPILVGMLTILFQFSVTAETREVWHAHLRKLLGMATASELSSSFIWWWLVCCTVCAACMLMMLQSRKRNFMSKLSHESKPSKQPSIETKRLCRPTNVANEVRVYVKEMVRQLIAMRVLKGVDDCRKLPEKFWIEVLRKDKPRLEFLNTSEMALELAREYFRPEMIDAAFLPAQIDIQQFCRCLQVSSRSPPWPSEATVPFASWCRDHGRCGCVLLCRGQSLAAKSRARSCMHFSQDHGHPQGCRLRHRYMSDALRA